MTLFIRQRATRARCGRCESMTDSPHSVVFYHNCKARKMSDLCLQCAATFDFDWLRDSDHVQMDRASDAVLRVLALKLVRSGRAHLIL